MPAYHGRVAFEASNASDGTLITNVFHLEVDTLSSPPDWNSIANDIGVWLGTLYTNMLSNNCRLDQIVVTDENYPGSTHGQGVSVSGVTGARNVADHKVSAGTCALVSFKTAVAKRYARGHAFLPPAYEAAALGAEGTWGTGDQYWVSCENFVNSFKAGHAAGSTSYTPEIFSRHMVQTGQTPFSFAIRSATLAAKQHFLRSRTTAP